MSWVELDAAITQRFSTNFWIDYPSIPVQFGDQPLRDSAWAEAAKPSPVIDDPEGSSWVRQTILPIAHTPETFSDDVTTVRIVFDVFTPYGAGTGWSTAICDSIASYFNRVQTLGVAYLGRDGQGPTRLPGFRTDDGFLQVPVSVQAQYWGGATADPLEFSETAHGFAVGDWVGYDSGAYAKALAGSIDPLFVVTAVPTANTFRVVGGGLAYLPSHGFTLGAKLYLSTSSAGDATETPTTTVGESKRVVGWAVHADYVVVEIMPEEVL